MMHVTEFSSAAYNQIENIHLENAKARVRARYGAAYQTSYYLTEDEIKTVTNLLNRPITFADVNLKRSSHPVAAVLNEFARNQAQHINDGNYLNIGGNPNKDRGVHFCTLLNNCRNHERIYTCTEDNICYDGAENCHFSAPNGVAVSIDALYDTPIKNLITIFNNHNIHMLHAWMFLPLELLDEDLKNFNNPLYNLDYTTIDKRKSTNKDYVTFSFKNDFSFVYKHKLNNWKKYIRTTLIKGPKFNISIEIKRSYGPFCHLTFFRTNFKTPIPRRLPFSDFFANYVKIPNFRMLACNEYHDQYKNIPKIIVPKNVVHSLYSYVTRGPDNSFSYERGATYFHGITSRIVIGNTVYVEELGVVGHDYDDILFSIMCLASLARLRRTKNFGEFVRSIDNDFRSDKRQILMFDLRGLYIQIKNFLFGSLKRGMHFNLPNSSDFMMFDMKIFDSVMANDVVETKYIKLKVKRPKCKVCHHKVCICYRRLIEEVDEESEADSESDSEESTSECEIETDNETAQSEQSVNTYTTVSDHASSLSARLTIKDEDRISIGTQHFRNLDVATNEDAIVDQISNLTICDDPLPSAPPPPTPRNSIASNHAKGSAIQLESLFTMDINENLHLKSPPAKDETIKANNKNATSAITSCNTHGEESDQTFSFEKTKPTTSKSVLQAEQGSKSVLRTQSREIKKRYEPKKLIKHHDIASDIISINSGNKRIKGSIIDKLAALEFIPKHIMETLIGYYMDSKISNDDKMFASIKEFENRLLPKRTSRGFAKFNYMVGKYIKNSSELTALDLSSAPGYCHALSFKKIIAANYTGVGAITPRFNHRFNKVYEYKHLSDLHVAENYDVLLCDIGNEEHDFDDYDIVLKFANTQVCIVKFYLEQYKQVSGFISHFKNVNLIKPAYSFSLNREFYAILRNYSNVKVDHNDYLHACYLAFVLQINTAYEHYLNGKAPRVLTVDVKADKTIKVFDQDNLKCAQRYIKSLCTSMADENTPEELKKILKSIVKNFVEEKIPKSFEVTIINGPPGCAKSTDIIKRFKKNGDLLIVPTNELKNRYIERGIKNVKTMHTALSDQRYYENIYVDEGFMQPVGYYAILKSNNVDANVFLYGDSNQIGLVDFQGTFGSNDSVECSEYNIVESKRCPLDVTNINKRFSFNTSNNKIFSIVKLPYGDFLKNDYLKKIKVITFSQKIKDILARGGYNVKTIHELQGDDVEHLIWYIDVDDKALLANNEKHINVAISRHSNTLFVVGEMPNTLDFDYYDSVFERMAEYHGRPVNSTVVYGDLSLEAIKAVKLSDKIFHDMRDRFDLNRAIEVIGKFVNIYGVASIFKSVNTNVLPEAKQGRAQINPDVVAKPEFIDDTKCLTFYNTARSYNSKDYVGAVKTLIGRYLLKTKNIENELVEPIVKELNTGLNKFLKCEVGSKEMCNILTIEQDEWISHFTDHMKVLSHKNLGAEKLSHEIDELDHKNGLLMIDYFMKKQDKFDVNYEFMLRQKLGQGVNAWSKVLNIVFSAFTRCFSEKFRKLLKSNVVYANGMSDVDIGNEIAKHLHNNKKKVPVQSISDDITEFDTTQSKVTVKFELQFYEMMKMSKFFTDLYTEHRSEWTAIYNMYCKIKGKDKQHSGQPATIDFNTLNCFSVNGVLFDFVNFVVAAAKGDDFYMASDGVEISDYGQAILDDLGFKCKVESTEVAEFIGYIQTEYGMYPDLLRVACKLLNKSILDEKYFEELKLAAHDRLSVIDCPAVQNFGRIALMQFYNSKFAAEKRNVVLNENDVFELESLLFNFKNIEYESLFKCKKLHVYLNPPSTIGGSNIEVKSLF